MIPFLIPREVQTSDNNIPLLTLSLAESILSSDHVKLTLLTIKFKIKSTFILRLKSTKLILYLW